MSESQAQNVQSNTADVLPDSTAGTGPGIKPVDIDAPYEHAPPKDGNPWTTLLTPELEVDTLRCDAWKDEVQNLLIFAGLFSAVVTTFIVESYKLLLPDPNAAMTGLLFHIASGLNNTSPFPSSVSPESILIPFSQTPSAIRINVFWFISLILSLTTVLVGTIALQWLREHQSYGGYSSKEKLAMLHMRSEALEAWYLPQIFAALPLLLQTALVLFLAGLIDFSLPLGTKLMMPVSIIVGLTLLFLAATTILPSLQGLSFFCGLYPRKSVPTPCPFKSPQSHAFRTLFGIALRAIFHIIPSPELFYDMSSPNKNRHRGLRIKNRSLLIADHLVPSVRKMWNQRTWPTLDREWLSLRDACSHRIVDHDPDLYHHRAHWEDTFPLSDATRYLVKVAQQAPGFKHTDSFLAALVYCFNELAESIWISTDYCERRDRHNNYFEAIHSMLPKSCSMSNLLLHGGIYNFNQLKEDYLLWYIGRLKVKLRLFSTDQTMIFLRLLLNQHPSPALLQYHQEMWMRVIHLIGNISPLTPAITIGSQSIPIPAIAERSTVYTILSDEHLAPGQRYLNTANILTTIFQLAASHRSSRDQTIESILAHPEMAEVLDTLASRTDEYLEWAQIETLTKQDTLRDIDDQLTQLVQFITDHFNARSNTSSISQNASLDILFYLTSIFSWNLLDWSTPRKILGNQDSHFGQALRSLLDALHKTRTSGRKNDLLEKRFRKRVDFGLERFSNEWWNKIFEHLSDPRITGQGPISAAEGPPDATIPHHPEASTEGARTINDYLLPYWRPSSNEPDETRPSGDNHTATGEDPLSVPPPPPSPSTADPDGVAPQQAAGNETSLSDAVDLHPDALHLAIDVGPPTSSQHVEAEAPGAGGECSLDEEGPEDVVIPSSVPHPAPSPSVADPEGVVPQQAAGNETSLSDEWDVQHLAIDVGPPTRSEHTDAETRGAGGDRSLDEAEPEDAVILVESPI